MAAIVSVGSGKGGVGKSVVVGNLALLLARRGKRVILADLDVGGADVHILFGLFHPSRTLTDFLARRVDSLDAIAQPVNAQSGLRIIPGTGETLATANMPYAKKQRLIRHLRKIDADIVLIDVGAGTSYHALDFFLTADYQLAVATPDPTSVLDLYRFIKLAAIRRVLSEFLARDAITEVLAEQDFTSVDEVLTAAGTLDESGRLLAREVLESFRPFLILNQVSARSRINTLQLKKLLRTYVGGELHVLGEIPEDEAVQRSVRTYLPVVDSAPNSPAAHVFTQIADQLLTLMASAASKQP